MTIEAIRAMRLQGKRPDRVFVIVGKMPNWLADKPNVVHVRQNDNPGLMDLRVLVRLPVNLVENGTDSQHFDRTLNAVQAAGGRIEGIAGPDGIVGENDEHARLLKNYREVLRG